MCVYCVVTSIIREVSSKPVIRFSDTFHYKSLQAGSLRKANIPMFWNRHLKVSREKTLRLRT